VRHARSGALFHALRCVVIALLASHPRAANAHALRMHGVQEQTVAGEWRYVVPPDGAAQRSPPESPLLLSPQVPEGLELELDPHDHDLWFAQIRYGDPGSVRIAIAVDRRKGADPVLYVDSQRKRTLGESERVVGQDGHWETTLAVSALDGRDAKLVPRRVSFRLGRTGFLLAYATLGYLEGEVEIEGRKLSARRVDADGNGFLTDAGDRIWIDLDGDGRWSPFDEQFGFAPLLHLGGARYALHSDRLGAALKIEKIEGVGRVRFRLNDAAGQPRKDVQALHAILVGKDGSAVGVEGHDVAVEAPVGEYRIGMVTLTLEDKQKSESWSFVFSEPGRDRDFAWRAVARVAELVIDPIGQLDFKAALDFEPNAVQAGDKLVARPSLHTADGLLINSCSRGSISSRWGSTPTARTVLLARDRVQLDEASSGFA